jgi:hypothetical protein
MSSLLQYINTLATIGILIVGWYQISQMRKEAKRERTLKICFAYDSDPIISKAVEKFRQFDENKITLDDITLHEKRTVLNYFDVLAIGVVQNSYDFEIIYPQFKNIIPSISKDSDIDSQNAYYPDLLRFIKRIEKRKREEDSV